MISLVAGGAGFLGSHLCEALLREGRQVVCVDNLATGRYANIEPLTDCRAFTFIEADVTHEFDVEGPVSHVFNLASPASPVAYLELPVETLMCGSVGTFNLLRLADRKDAHFILASTSEVYGDAAVHPQPESYFGNVNPTGPRSVYDEAKRFAEALTFAFHRAGRARVAIARIFNTYGPRMRPDDGRVVSTFIEQALAGKALTVHGSGDQTRSLCFVDDTVDGMLRLRNAGCTGPLNIGNDFETTVREIAEKVIELTGSGSLIEFVQPVAESPRHRRPDLHEMRKTLGWAPRVSVEEGLRWTIAWHRAAGAG
jgi:dTDP-glucose 4,6-dehydratase